MHEAIRDAVPSLGSAADVKALLRLQYPNVSDISDDELLATIRKALGETDNPVESQT